MGEKKDKYLSQRSRNFCTIVYPDSENTPENWLEILADYHVPCFVSPFHDKDKNPTGEDKKPHYHVMFMFDSMKTVNQVMDYISVFGGVGVEVVKNTRSMARYLCHLDNPDKAPYPTSAVKELCGSDYLSMIESCADKDIVIDQMCDYCVRNNIFSFFQLAEYARKNKPEWSRHLKRDSTLYMREYLKSMLWTIENTEKLKHLKINVSSSAPLGAEDTTENDSDD